MGRRYSFQLFFAADRIAGVLNVIDRMRPVSDRGQAIDSCDGIQAQLSRELMELNPDRPLFREVSLLFPADEIVRAYCTLRGVKSEWSDEGVESLPVGMIDLEIRVGVNYAVVMFIARTSRMSELFRDAGAVWDQFSALLNSCGGLLGLFDGVDHGGTAKYLLLSNGIQAIEFNFFDFVIEERDVYWHIDTDRYAEMILKAPRVAGRTKENP